MAGEREGVVVVVEGVQVDVRHLVVVMVGEVKGVVVGEVVGVGKTELVWR